MEVETANLPEYETVIRIQKFFLHVVISTGSMVIGCRVTPDDFTNCVKKPTALWLTTLAVVFVAPLSAYVLSLALHLHFSDGITILVASCCPADILSPIFAYYTNADVTLCLSVIVLTTAMSVGMIPLGIVFCSSAFSELNLVEIPHDTIVLILIQYVIGLSMGMALRKYNEKWANHTVRFLSFVPPLLVIVMVTLTTIQIPRSIQASLVGAFSVLIYLLLMVAVTYIIGALSGQEHATSRAMALCAANKSTLLVLTIVHNSYPGDVLAEALPVPTLLVLVYIALGVLLSALHIIYTNVKERQFDTTLSTEARA
ncbi:ileal sodium/bile acid cotransporter-like [Asterias amurensis]|uniref:ileal sodium/bile acid cotransporter-like n=1 Tax=Asterias amurensis TaxID=7602 RepID=UPI003AB1E553